MATRLKDLHKVFIRNYVARVNTFCAGKPAIGKSQCIEAFAAKMREKMPDFKVWQFYAPTMSPMDIQASAPNYDTHKLEMFNNAALPNAYDDADMTGVVFLGEFPNADPATAKLLQKYVNGEDMSGCLRKPTGVVVIADGNRIEDKSGVQQQGRALMSRFEQHDVFVDANDNMEYASQQTWHPTVQTFFKDNPALIDNYEDVFETKDAARQRSAQAQATNGNATSEEGKRGIWANMRAWERISKKEYAADQMNMKVELSEIAGNVGMAVAAQYGAHRDIISKLAAYQEIVADPENAKCPEVMDEQYMMSMMIALKCKIEDFAQVKTYAMRLPLEFQAVVLREMTKRKGFNLSNQPEYTKWITNKELTNLITGR